MVTRKDINPNGYIETPEISMNINVLLDRVNRLISLGAPVTKVNSGLRSEADQARINPSTPKSKHLIGAAADLADKDGKLKEWCLNNPNALAICELWCEDAAHTPTWLHVQIFPPKSGKRWFIP